MWIDLFYMGGASVYTILQQKSQKTERKRKERKNSSHTNKKLIGAHGSHWEPIGAYGSQMKRST